MGHGKEGGLRTSWVEEPLFRSVACLLNHNTLIGSEYPMPRWGMGEEAVPALTMLELERRGRNEHD
jgi:hypothetical protein